MKILRLEAENVKKIRAIEIAPTGELVEISGPNGAGKSSILDAIWWALAGTKHIQAAPIRTGATKARIKLDLGELVVERRFSAAGSTLTVEDAGGARFGSPQGILDALLGALALDPLAFVGENPREQFEALRRIVPLGLDLDVIDERNAADFTARTAANRRAKEIRAQAAGVTVPANLPPDRIDAAALKDRMASAAKINAEIEQRRGRRTQAERDVADQRREAAAYRVSAANLRAQADADEKRATELDEQAETLQVKLDAAEPLPALVDADAIRAELDAAEQVNRGIEQRERKKALLSEANEHEVDAEKLTDAMAERTASKSAALAAAKMPVEGLGFGDGIVTFVGLPLDQASTAEQLRVSVALAMAANPKLRVLRIKEGSLLDAGNLALIAEMAREHDYQVWIETVTSGDRKAVEIRDGMVLGGDAAEAVA